MNEMNEIKLPKGVDRIAVKQHDDKIVIEFIPKEPKFKDGDFVYQDGRIMIVNSYPNMYHANVYPEHSNIVCYNGRYGVDFSSPTFRYAAEEEKQLLIDVMKNDGKRWNAETMEIEDIPKSKFKVGDAVRIKNGISSKTHGHTGTNFLKDMDEFVGKKFTICEIGDNADFGFYYRMRGNVWSYSEDWLEPYVEEPKKGDLAIFWDNDYHYPLIRPYDTKADDGRGHFDNYGSVWDNTIKWDGTKEQFEKVLRGEIN